MKTLFAFTTGFFIGAIGILTIQTKGTMVKGTYEDFINSLMPNVY